MRSEIDLWNPYTCTHICVPQTHAHACTHTGDKGIPTDDHKVCQFSEKGLAQGVGVRRDVH